MTLKWKRANKTEKTNETEIEQYDWFVERIQTLVAFDWLSERLGEKTPHAENVMLQHHWPIEQCLPHTRVFFGGKTKSPRFDLFIHWLIKQIMDIYRNQFSRSYENRSDNMKLWIYAENRGVKRVSMGLTDRRKTAKNLADSRKNWKILTVSRK